ncbi:MAG TPA: hypothetical protein DDY13_11155 [Cytophagales bacterium]|jgi:hypothetical protein|nr:hypothetical protein [Cytophagales bacterium]
MKTSEQVKYISRQFNRASGKLLQNVEIKETAKTVHLTGIYKHKTKKRIVSYITEEKAVKVAIILPKQSNEPGQDYKLKISGVQNYLRLKIADKLSGPIRKIFNRYKL